MLSPHSATAVPTSSNPPPPRTATSDPRQVTMDTYWREVQSIEEEQEGVCPSCLFGAEVELDEAWLTEAGFSSLVVGSSSTEAPPAAEAVLATLTRQQAATVKKRLDNYNETLRKRNRQSIRDVRDVFTEVGHEERHTGSFSQTREPTQVCCDAPPARLSSPADVSLSLGFSGGSDDPVGRFHSPGLVPVTVLLDMGPVRNTGQENSRRTIFHSGSRSDQQPVQDVCLCPPTRPSLSVQALRRELDRCWSVFDWTEVRPVDAAGLLKLFIRELPTPLLTHTHLSTFCVSSEVHQVQALQLLLLLLPEAHRNTLKALLVFLRKVVSHEDHNRMTLWNVSMVMAPNLFTRCNHGNKPSVAKQRGEMEEAVGGAHLIRLMIRHQDLLWTVSLTTCPVPLRELCEGVIRVHAPLHTKVSMAVQLDEQTTARDVTARTPAAVCLTDERRLHPDCSLLEVYRDNPRCDWLVRP
uniref:Rho-GAP domain-containing protein n=1 Tax=Fundulus heteroclitus TaxID=8078 RepID=A0A3Q2P999_FUNHE